MRCIADARMLAKNLSPGTTVRIEALPCLFTQDAGVVRSFLLKMRKTILSLVMGAPLLFGQAQTFTYTYSGLPIPIYPDDWDSVAVATIFVPRSISISKVTASVQVQYSGVGDLNVFMWSAAGTRIRLLERNCGNLQNVDTTFDDAAGSRYSDSCPTEAGRGPFRGNEPLSNANGQLAFGYWRIGVENNGSDDRTGTLTAFSITITGTPVGSPAIGPNTIVSTSSFQGGDVAPGDQVSIFGVNLGPFTGVRAEAGRPLPTSLGGTTVTFDGVAAPVFYVSDKFVTVQAPVLTAGSTRVQVTSSSGVSSAVSVPVVPVKPGIITYEAGGKGQAKAINQDGSLNGNGSANNSSGAAPGSVIALYATGLGAVNPSIAPGNPTPASPLSMVTTPVSAAIGGRAAQVTYAGAAPGLIGTYQVNVLVPVALPSGAARIVLSQDGNSSQDEVTVQIR
jgi:uncharacterized protein (TIGR03437 family)